MRQRTKRHIQHLRVIATCAALLVAVPTAAHAACTPAQRADAAALTRVASQLATNPAPAAVDAVALARRARRSCADLRPARALLQATLRNATPALGTRRRVLDINLIVVRDAGRVVWRVDIVRLATRLATTRRASAIRTLRARVTAHSFGRTAPIWSNDPTRVRWDADRQSAVAAALAASPRSSDRRIAARGIHAFAHKRRLTTPAKAGLLTQLRISNRLARAAQRTGSASARSTARRVALRALTRMRSAKVRGWSKIGGAWSTARQHRTLVSQARLLVTRVPHAASRTVVDQLVKSLTAPPVIKFSALPTDAFYPWPRDEAFDSQAVSITTNKPAAITMTMYRPDTDDVVRTVVAQHAEPGAVTLAWDGGDAAGAIVDPGTYRYNVDATDLLGNDVRVPGLEQFTVARDTTKPTVNAAGVRFVRSGGKRRIITTWDIEEVHSPHVKTWLILRNDATRSTMKLNDRSHKATVRRTTTLDAGTWNATLVFVDGSGNRTSHTAGRLVLR